MPGGRRLGLAAAAAIVLAIVVAVPFPSALGPGSRAVLSPRSPVVDGSAAPLATSPRAVVLAPPAPLPPENGAGVGTPPPAVIGWTPLENVGTAPDLSGQAMAYDPADGSVVAFGGESRSFFSPPPDGSNQTWMFDGTWSQLHPATSPSARSDAGLVWDPSDGYLVLFGGINVTDGVALNDTWAFENGNWIRLAPATAPAARFGFGFAWDPTLGGALLYGGCGSTGYFGTCSALVNGGTWSFLGGNWTEISSAASPPNGVGERLSLDPTTGSMVLVGAPDVDGISSTWAFGRAGWTGSNASAPPFEEFSAIAFDPGLDGLVAFVTPLNKAYAV